MNKYFKILISGFMIIAVLGCVTNKSLPDGEDYNPVINPSDFVEGINNPYLPYTPGIKMIYEGNTDEGKERIEVVVTDETRFVMGVECMVVRDTVWLNGDMVEDTYDWFAQDRYGNVWYMGEDSWEYKNGVKLSPEGSWEAGVDGALPGILMHANPVAGIPYRQEFYKGEAEDMGEVSSLNEEVTVPYGTFTDCIKTYEWNPLEPGATEYKYYAKGVGVILEKEVGGSEKVELIDIIK
jgi:hypothetical protein